VAACLSWVAGCASAPARQGQDAPVDPSQAGSDSKISESKIADLRSKVVSAHNRARTEAKLRTLEVNERLDAAAQSHARHMAARRTMTHKGVRGSRPFDRIKAQGSNYRRAGENVAAGPWKFEQLMKIWLESPPHKRNILGGFSQIGVGCAIAEDGKPYWCVTFGLPVYP